MADSDQDGPRGWRSEIGPFLSLGIQLAAAVLVFFLAGRWLDGHFETDPLWTMIGLFVGACGGLIQFFRTVRSLENK